jgi:hypothetical protein
MSDGECLNCGEVGNWCACGERDAVPASRNELRCEDCNSELVMVGWTAGGLDMTEPVESYDCPLCRVKADRAALHEAAWRLSTWAASINWDGRGNTQSWLEGLRERIEAVQAFGKPQTAPQPEGGQGGKR